MKQLRSSGGLPRRGEFVAQVVGSIEFDTVNQTGSAAVGGA